MAAQLRTLLSSWSGRFSAAAGKYIFRPLSPRLPHKPSRVLCLDRLQDGDIRNIIKKALDRLSSSSPDTSIPTNDSLSQNSEPSPSTSAHRSLTDKVITTIVALSAGDARIAISLLELAVKTPNDFDEAKILTFLRRSVATSYDPAEDHYNMISAMHKSVRGSCPDAALYWLARMLAGGEDPVFICRRMVVCASEDVGLADNHALPLVCPDSFPTPVFYFALRRSPLFMLAKTLECPSVESISLIL